MIVHQPKIGERKIHQIVKEEHKKVFVGCAESDIRYRDMLVDFRQRWEFYTKNTIDFLTFDRNELESDQWKGIVEKSIRSSDGVMVIVSERTALDSLANWEIDCALSNGVPIVGVDIGKNPEGNIPKRLVGR